MTPPEPEKVYLSTDHKTFCVKHRSHSVSYSLCSDCFNDQTEKLSAAREALKMVVPILVILEDKFYGESQRKRDVELFVHDALRRIGE